LRTERSRRHNPARVRHPYLTGGLIQYFCQLWKSTTTTILNILMCGEPVSDVAGVELLPSDKQPAARKPSFLTQIYQCIAVGILALASYFVISHFILQSVQVVGESMVPTLFDSQQYLLNRWVYY